MAEVDVAIVEIGGTVGDIESLPFLEAVRQMSLRAGPTNTAFVHLTYVPWIAAAGELKTKPTQHTVQKLREIGIQPDVLLCRADRPVPDDERDKISLFTNVLPHGVISMWDVDTIYKVPRLLHNGDIHGMRVGLEARVPFADTELLALAATVSPAAGLADGEKTRLRAALRGALPESIRLRRKSALPKDQACAAIYQQEAARLLAEPPELVRELIDLGALRPLLDPARPLGEWERAALFRVIVLCHFTRHHGIS